MQKEPKTSENPMLLPPISTLKSPGTVVVSLRKSLFQFDPKQKKNIHISKTQFQIQIRRNFKAHT